MRVRGDAAAEGGGEAAAAHWHASFDAAPAGASVALTPVAADGAELGPATRLALADVEWPGGAEPVWRATVDGERVSVQWNAAARVPGATYEVCGAPSSARVRARRRRARARDRGDRDRSAP